MEHPLPPGAPRPGYPTQGYNPNYQRPPNTLADNMQNMHISRPTGPPTGAPTGMPSGPPTGMPGSSFPRPPSFGSSPHMPSAPSGNPFAPTSNPPSAPPSSYPGASLGSRPGAPPSGFPRGPPSVSAPHQSISQPSLASGRPSGPPFSQPPPPGARPFSGPFSSAPMTSGPTSPPSNAYGPLTNGPPALGRGNMPGAPTFSLGNNQQPPVGPPTGMGPRGPLGQTMRPFPGSPVSSNPMGQTAQPPPFPPGGQGMFPPTYGSQTGQMQPMMQGPPPNQGGMPPRMYGMPPMPLPGQSMPMGGPGMSHMQPGGLSTGPSKIDPNQIPRPFPSSSASIYETRQGGQANIPPPATSDYVVKDTGNCSPRYMRCTINQIPCTADLLSTSSMQLALMVQPFALPHPSEEPIQLVDFGEGGPVRCSRCKGYINPFMKFVDQGKRFICNLCGFSDETPRDYHAHLGPDGRRRDADQRPELCRGTVEFVATKEFMVRDPMPAVFFFLVDVSMNAIQTGATAAACNAISQAIADLPEGPRTLVGFATFDSTIHFYNLKRILQQPLMLIVPDIEDVYTPLQTDVIVQLAECRQHLEQLLDSIPTMFQSNKVADSAFGAATKAAFLAMKSTGGKLLVFQSVLPSVGFGALSARDTEGRSHVSSGEKEVQKLLQPADKTLKTMAIEFAEYQVCVDIFLTSQTYVDIASVSVIPNTTGGQVYYYYPFSALSDSAKLYNDLKWNVTRPQGFEAVMRVRCSQGLQVQEYSGSFCKRIPTDVDLPAIDCDKTIMVTFKHDDKLVEGTECAFQCALLYTTVYGERRIRVSTLSLPCTSVLSNLFRAADLDAQFAYFAKFVANEVPAKPIIQVREQVISQCVNILTAYRKFCATVSSSGQLILPEALKLLPLYTLALVKSIGLRTDGKLDEQAYWISHMISLTVPLTVPLVYPRMMAIHKLTVSEEETDSLFPPILPLSSEHLEEDGVYLLENGEDGLIYVGKEASIDVLQQIFGVPSIDKVPTQFVLQQFENELSRKLNDLVNEIRGQRCSYLRLRLCKKGDVSENLFFAYMVEDKSPASASYVEFLVHIHRQIQAKMA